MKVDLGEVINKIQELDGEEYEVSISIKPTNNEDGKIEKLNDILSISDLKPPYNFNVAMIWKNVIIQQNKINQLIEKINEMEKNENIK